MTDLNKPDFMRRMELLNNKNRIGAFMGGVRKNYDDQLARTLYQRPVNIESLTAGMPVASTVVSPIQPPPKVVVASTIDSPAQRLSQIPFFKTMPYQFRPQVQHYGPNADVGLQTFKNGGVVKGGSKGKSVPVLVVAHSGEMIVPVSQKEKVKKAINAYNSKNPKGRIRIPDNK